MTKPELSNQQISALKSQAHALKPIVRVGQHGVTDAVLTELDIALSHHELLKVKISSADRTLRDDLIMQLATKTKATVIQRIGGIVVLFREKPAAPVKKARASKKKPAAKSTRNRTSQDRARSTRR